MSGAAALKEFACFAELSDEQRESFATAMQELVLDEGEEIFREGDDADGLLLLVEGRLRLERRDPARTGTLGPGAALGAVSLVASGRREVSAFAAEGCRILWLPRSAWRRVAEDEPRAACRFLESALGELATLVRPDLAAAVAAGVDRRRDEE